MQVFAAIILLQKFRYLTLSTKKVVRDTSRVILKAAGSSFDFEPDRWISLMDIVPISYVQYLPDDPFFRSIHLKYLFPTSVLPSFPSLRAALASQSVSQSHQS
jgi:hypothetical protein